RDRFGNLYVADRGNFRIRKIGPDGIITTVAGTGRRGEGADGTPASSGAVSYIISIAVDSAGSVYFVDDHLKVRKITKEGTLTTIAGTGTQGDSGDNGPGTLATFQNLIGVAVDAAGNVYVADGGTLRVRKITAATGKITAWAGGGAGKAVS